MSPEQCRAAPRTCTAGSSLHAQGPSPEGSPVSAADCDMLGPCCSSTVSPSLIPSWSPPPSSGASAGRGAALQQRQTPLGTTCGLAQRLLCVRTDSITGLSGSTPASHCHAQMSAHTSLAVQQSLQVSIALRQAIYDSHLSRSSGLPHQLGGLAYRLPGKLSALCLQLLHLCLWTPIQRFRLSAWTHWSLCLVPLPETGTAGQHGLTFSW